MIWSRGSFSFTTTEELSEQRVFTSHEQQPTPTYSTAVGATDFFENCQQQKQATNEQQFGDTGLLQQIPLYN